MSGFESDRSDEFDGFAEDAQEADDDDERKLLTPSDVLDMASYLGIDSEAEPWLLELARDAVLAELPPGWEEHIDANGDPFYVRLGTGTTTSEHPSDEHYRQLLIRARRQPAPAQYNKWMDFVDPQGNTFFYNFERNIARYDTSTNQHYEQQGHVEEPESGGNAMGQMESVHVSTPDTNGSQTQQQHTPQPPSPSRKPAASEQGRGRDTHLRIPGAHLRGWSSTTPTALQADTEASAAREHTTPTKGDATVATALCTPKSSGKKSKFSELRELPMMDDNGEMNENADDFLHNRLSTGCSRQLHPLVEEDAEYDEDVLDKADELGIDPYADRDHMWIAEDALERVGILPTGWLVTEQDDERVPGQAISLYECQSAGTRQLTHPHDEFYRFSIMLARRKALRGRSTKDAREEEAVVKAELKAGKKKLKAMKKRLRELEKTNADWEEQASLVQAEYWKIKKELHAVNAKVGSQYTQIENLNAEVHALRQHEQQHGQSFDQQSEQKAPNGLANSSSNADGYNNACAPPSADSDESSKTINRLQIEVNQLRKAVATGVEAQNAASSSVVSLAELDRLKAKEEEVHRLAARCNELERESTNLKQVLVELESANQMHTRHTDHQNSEQQQQHQQRLLDIQRKATEQLDSERRKFENREKQLTQQMEELRASAAAGLEKALQSHSEAAAAAAAAAAEGTALQHRTLEADVAQLREAVATEAAGRQAAQARAEEEGKQRLIEKERAENLQTSLHKQAFYFRNLRSELRQLREDYTAVSAAVQLHGAVDFGSLQQLVSSSCMPRPQIEQVLSSIEADASERVTALTIERKRLQNLVLELKGNIRVICRVRPLSTKETASGEQSSVTFPAGGEITLMTGPTKARNFEFDFVADMECTQAKLYNEVAALGQSVLDGFNCCVFAYGQTGSGKTYTMTGTPADPGVNARLMAEIYKLSTNSWTGCLYTFSLSLVEIYNDNIRDLLNTNVAKTGTKDMKKKTQYLDIKLDPSGEVMAAGLQENICGTFEAAIGVMEAGLKNRSVGATAMNAQSSRSHLIVTLKIHCHNQVSGKSYTSKLNMVDLAGSERLSRTEAVGDRLKEAQAINKSLSALGDVMSSLARKDKHVPYRNSRLTYYLQDSLGGDSKTIMVVNTSPTVTSATETECSLRFAERVRKVELGTGKAGGKKTSGTGLAADAKAKYEQALQEQEARVSALQEELRATKTRLRHATSDGSGARRPGRRH